MADDVLSGRAPRTLMVNTYGYRPGIDVQLGTLREGETLVYDGLGRVATQRANPFRCGVSLGGGAGLATYRAYTDWVGNTQLIASDFCADAQWSDIEAPNFIFDAWAPWQAAYPNNWLALAVHLLPQTLPWSTAQNVIDGANGVHDAHFNTLADNIIASGLKNLIIRLDHEFNLHTIPSASTWVTYWKRVVNLLRAKFTAASGVRMQTCWNFSNNQGGVDLDALWPGSPNPTVDVTLTGTALAIARAKRKYPLVHRFSCPEVDFIGIDIYDQYGEGYTNGVQPTAAQQTQAFHTFLNGFNEFAVPPDVGYFCGSMQYAAILSRETGVPLCVPEWGTWGVGHGRPAGGDNPTFIRKMHDWMRTAGVSWANYFDITLPAFDAYHQLWPGVDNNITTDFPRARDEYLRLF